MVFGALRPVSTVLSVLFSAFALGHLLILPPGVAGTLAAIALSSALIFVTIAGSWSRISPHLNGLGTHLLATGVVAVIALNCTVHLRLTQDPGTSVNFVILTAGIGLLLLAPRWLFANLALVVAMWGMAVLSMPGFPLLKYGLMMAGAVTAAGLASLGRRVMYNSVIRLRIQSEERARDLEKSEERLRLAMQGSNDGLYDWDLVTGQVFWSERVLECFDSDIPAGGNDFSQLTRRIHAEDFDRVAGRFADFLKSEGSLIEDEFRLRYPDGEYRWVLARGACTRDAEGRVLRLAGSITDMSRRGVFDALTGLPNRRLLLDRLDRLTSRPTVGEEEETFSVLFLDLDDFKIVNDSLGHQTGDALLQEVARRLLGCVRGSDTVARLGGDEFVVLLEKIQVPAGVQVTIDRIVAKLAEPFLFEGRELYVRASIGVVMDTQSYTGSEEILRDADTAMYRAKDSNPEYIVFDATMRERLSERLRLETELRRALARDEFIVHFQTIVSLNTGAVEGLEALVRWQHPERGLLMPGEFIDVMEDTGLVVPLGPAVLNIACRQMVEWFSHMRPDDMPYLSVNLSGKHLSQEDPAGAVEAVLNETGFPAHRLRIELTESAIIEHPRRAAAALSQMKLLGVRVLMDDFGTGQSSLAYLQKLPIDTLKIDRSFISTMTAQREGEALVRTIVRMADSLGLNVVAEGIETDEQARMLRAMRCGSGQGYLFARPQELGLITFSPAQLRGSATEKRGLVAGSGSDIP